MLLTQHDLRRCFWPIHGQPHQLLLLRGAKELFLQALQLVQLQTLGGEQVGALLFLLGIEGNGVLSLQPKSQVLAQLLFVYGGAGDSF